MEVADIGNGSVTDGKNKYSLDKLYKITQNNTKHKIPIEKFKKFMNQRRYKESENSSKLISLHSIVKYKNIYKSHYQIKNANTKYSVLIPEVDDGGPIYVIDGLHRIAKLYYLLKRKKVVVQYTSLKDLKKSKI